ncbi:MAG: M16 family metallopeptidase [Candidatus Aminicenantia bacterium]
MKVFILERHSLPLINIVTAVNVGSKDEDELTNGFTHLLEHLILFRGTEKKSGEEIGWEMRKHGAYFNGHTGKDVTTFEISLPSEHLDFALEIHKEMLFNLKITEDNLFKEKKVVMEEINSYLDDPGEYAKILMFEQLFKDHPYSFPPTGKKEVIEKATVEEIYSFYRNYFTPNNCALTIVGDIDIEEVSQKIREIFEPLPKNQIPQRELISSKPLEKTVKSTLQMDVTQAYLVIGMLGPAFNHPDQFAVDVLLKIIGSGFNHRLWRTLKGRRNLVHSISMNYVSYKYSGAIIITATLPSKHLTTVIREIRKILKEARTSRYSKEEYVHAPGYLYASDEIESAKNQIRVDHYSAQEIGLNLARGIAQFLILSEGKFKEGYLSQIKNVTSSNLRKVTGKYLYKDRYSIVTIIPKSK